MAVGIIDYITEQLNKCAGFPQDLQNSKDPNHWMFAKGAFLRIPIAEHIEKTKNAIVQNADSIAANIRDFRSINTKINPAVARLRASIEKMLSNGQVPEIGNWDSLAKECRKLLEQIDFYYPVEDGNPNKAIAFEIPKTPTSRLIDLFVELANRMKLFAFVNNSQPTPTIETDAIQLLECLNNDWSVIVGAIQDRADQGLPITPEIQSLYDSAKECASLECCQPTPGEPPMPGIIFADKAGALARTIAARYRELNSDQENGQNEGNTEPSNNPDNKSNAIDVDGRENAPKWPLPGWLPQSIYDGWEKQRLIDGNLWKGTLYELVSELANISDFIVGRNKDGENEYRWNLADGVFDYYAKNGQQRTALTETLRDACKYAKEKGLL